VQILPHQKLATGNLTIPSNEKAARRTYSGQTALLDEKGLSPIELPPTYKKNNKQQMVF